MTLWKKTLQPKWKSSIEKHCKPLRSGDTGDNLQCMSTDWPQYSTEGTEMSDREKHGNEHLMYMDGEGWHWKLCIDGFDGIGQSQITPNMWTNKTK